MKREVKNQLAVLCFASIIFLPAASAENLDTVLIGSPDASVTRQDFEAFLDGIPPGNRAEFMLDQNKTSMALQNLYVQKVLANEARKISLDKDPLIAKKIELSADLILAAKRMEQVTAAVKLPDFEARAKEKYKVDLAQYKVPQKVNVWHYLAAAPEKDDSAALARANEIYAKVVAGTENLKELAKGSDDPSARYNGGNLGFVDAARVVKPFADAAFALEPGQVSKPVKTNFGYHVIKVLEKKDAYTMPFEDVRDGIIQKLRDDYLIEVKIDYTNAIKVNEKIVVNAEAIRELKPKVVDSVVDPKKGAQDLP